ncbi:MAG: hypothetical protein ABIJ17_00975 [Patescibacteria group bacterium]
MIWFLIFLDLIIVLIVTFVLFFSLIGLIRSMGVPFVPLTKKQLESVNKYIKLNPNDRVVDLGCGDARVLRMFKKQGVKDLTGYEVNLLAYLLAKIKSKSLKIYFKNFKKVDLSEYNVIFCYLLDYYLDSLKEKFDKELKPGTKVISYAFRIKNWRRPEIIYTKTSRIFIYTIE